MVQTPAKTMTLAEFLQQPETKPAREYIDGHIIQKPMPQGQHSTIQGELVTAINAVTKPSKLAWAFPELRCTFGGRSIIPDVSVFRWQRLPTNDDGTIANTFSAAPDWTIEILSSEQSMYQYFDGSGCPPMTMAPLPTPLALPLTGRSKFSALSSRRRGW
ncbi:hypothetical protein C8255_20125 [filamentous cyanobacterium CCP3]|nr:hypothetical protein C8255_20125 [filamentous cyanobacterium CCP3]